MTNEKKRMVPELRFRGFTDDWEQRKLSDVATFWDSQRIPVTASDRVPGETPYYGANGIQDHIEGYTHEGTYVLIAEDGANDLINYPVQIIEGRSWVNNHAHVVQGITAQLDTKFLAYRISSMDISRWLVGGGRAKLNGEVLQKMPITIPRSEEQTMIRRLLSNLDKTLVLHQRKHEALLKLKEAYLQKLFPEKDNKYPVLRFAGFTDDWEQRKLGDLGVITSASRVHKEEWTTNGVRFLRSSDIVSSFNGVDNTPAFISNKLYQTLIAKSGTPLKGDILITGGGSIGIPYIINDPYPVYFKDADSIWFKQSDSFNSRFLFYFLQSPGYRRHLSQVSHVGTIAHYTIEQVQATPIKIPVIEEQMVIENLLSELDDALALHQRKLEKLQELKKGYLQKMFC